VSLESHLEVAVRDTGVEFTLVVTNAGKTAIDLEFPSGQTVDFVVTDDGFVWRWSDDRMFTQAGRSEVLEPETSLTERAVWNDPPSGCYAVEATLTSPSVDVTERMAFEI
jgi:hypothetical protein